MITKTDFKKVVDNAIIDIECGITGIDVEDYGIHIYGFIDNDDLELKDIVISYNNEVIETAEWQRELVKTRLINTYKDSV